MTPASPTACWCAGRSQRVGAGSAGGLRDDTVAQIATRIGARVGDPVYAQTLLSELGADGLAQLLLAAGVTSVRCTRRHDASDPRRLRLTRDHGNEPSSTPGHRPAYSRAAGVRGGTAHDLVAGVDTVRVDPSGGGRATGAWLLGQLLSGARAVGDDRRPGPPQPTSCPQRPPPPRSPRPATRTRRCGTAPPYAPMARELMASWFDDASPTDHPARPARERGRRPGRAGRAAGRAVAQLGGRRWRWNFPRRPADPR